MLEFSAVSPHPSKLRILVAKVGRDGPDCVVDWIEPELPARQRGTAA